MTMSRSVMAGWVVAACLGATGFAGVAVAQTSPHAANAPAPESKRVALVVGNARYTGVPVLVNTLNDAEDVCNTLRELKFEVMCAKDLRNRREFKRTVQEFTSKLGPGRAGLFYYAGHGLQIDGENYLVPTEAPIEKKEDVEDETISMRYVMTALEEARSDFNLIILDACRNSPFTRGFSRSAGRGLAPVSETPTGSLVLYSTAANDTASDGPSGQRKAGDHRDGDRQLEQSVEHAIDIHASPLRMILSENRVPLFGIMRAVIEPWRRTPSPPRPTSRCPCADRRRIRPASSPAAPRPAWPKPV